MTRVRTGPDCASIGLARDAFAGVKHSPAFSRLAQRRIAGVLFAARLSMMTNSRYPSGRAARTDFSAARCGRALMLASDAPQLVIAHAVAAMEGADAAGAMISRAQPGRPFARRPAHAVAGPDRQRPGLAGGQATVRAGAGHVLDPVQLGVPVRIGGLLPGPGPLERVPRSCSTCRGRSRPIRTGRPRPVSTR